jgi:cystathionine beta-synthase
LNIDAHYKSTGPEIWKQRDYYASCCFSGTGGTISGTAKYLNRTHIKILVDAWISSKKSTMKPESLIVMRFIHIE